MEEWMESDDRLRALFIVTYRDHPSRVMPLVHCLRSIRDIRGSVEIALVESGPNISVMGMEVNYYMFIQERGGLFDQGKAFNAGMRKFHDKTPGSGLVVFSDADLLFPEDYLSKITETPCAGWGRIDYYSWATTRDYMRTGRLGRSTISRRPHPLGAAGGVTVMTRDQWEAVGGFPEGFDGWGGMDNAMWSRLLESGFPFKTVEDTVLRHLYHPVTQPRSVSGRAMVAQSDGPSLVGGVGYGNRINQ